MNKDLIWLQTQLHVHSQVPLGAIGSMNDHLVLYGCMHGKYKLIIPPCTVKLGEFYQYESCMNHIS